jgi:hypothetical protein
MYREIDMNMRMVMSSVTKEPTHVHHHMNVVMLAAMGMKGYRK